MLLELQRDKNLLQAALDDLGEVMKVPIVHTDNDSTRIGIRQFPKGKLALTSRTSNINVAWLKEQTDC